MVDSRARQAAIVLPMTEQSLAAWLIAVAKGARVNLTLGKQLQDDAILYMAGMQMALLYPELAHAVLAKMPAEAVNGLVMLGRCAVQPFQFEEQPPTPEDV